MTTRQAGYGIQPNSALEVPACTYPRTRKRLSCVNISRGSTTPVSSRTAVTSAVAVGQCQCLFNHAHLSICPPRAVLDAHFLFASTSRSPSGKHRDAVLRSRPRNTRLCPTCQCASHVWRGHFIPVMASWPHDACRRRRVPSSLPTGDNPLPAAPAPTRCRGCKSAKATVLVNTFVAHMRNGACHSRAFHLRPGLGTHPAREIGRA
jgi:hypothetical protein